MLTAYLTRTQQLLQNPPASTQLYPTSDLTAFINSARGQLAGETECVRVYATLALAAAARSAAFTSASFGSTTGISGIFALRGATISLASGQVWLRPRPFPWFQLYHLNNPIPPSGIPTVYSQFGQGVSGSIYVDPLPDQAYTLNLDAVCQPVNLGDDTTPEAIPYPYTDAVPYYAAYLALTSAQRTSDAHEMWQQYQTFASRARSMSNSAVNPGQYPQSGNPVRAGQLGIQAQVARGAQGGGG